MMMTWVDCIDASQKNVSMPDGLWFRKKLFLIYMIYRIYIIYILNKKINCSTAALKSDF